MYLRMNVGIYKGEIRGPFHHEAAKALLARGDATRTESIGDGKFRAIEQEESVQESGQELETTKKKGRR